MPNHLNLPMLLSVLPLAAQLSIASPPPCPDKAPCKQDEIRINAATGAVFGDTFYRRSRAVKVVIFNKNPFCCKYKLSIKSKALDDGVLLGAATSMGLLVPTTPPTTASGTKPESDQHSLRGSAELEIEVPNVPSMSGPTKEAVSAIDRLRKAILEIYTIRRKARDAQKIYSDQIVLLRSPDLGEDGARCSARIVLQLASMKHEEPGCPDSPIAAPTVGELKNGYLELAAGLENLRQIRPTFKNSAAETTRDLIRDAASHREKAAKPGAAVESLNQEATKLEASATQLAFTVAKVDAESASLEAIGNEELSNAKDALRGYEDDYAGMVGTVSRLSVVLKSPTAFSEEAMIARDISNGRAVTVTLEVAVPDEQGKLGDFTKKAEAALQFGYQVMTVSTGIAGSSMKKTQYGAVSSTAKDAAGQSATTNTIGIQSDSPRLLPMLQLNADLYDFRFGSFPLSLNASMGLTGKYDTQGTDIEFLIGPSLGFLGNRLYIAVGAYGGRQQVLQNGLNVGSTIPSTTVPIGKNLQWSLGWSLTWKVK